MQWTVRPSTEPYPDLVVICLGMRGVRAECACSDKSQIEVLEAVARWSLVARGHHLKLIPPFMPVLARP